MMDCIQRVDKLMREKNIKSAEIKKKQASQRLLELYQKQKKKEMLKLYSESIKEANKKALIKLKARDKKTEKLKKKVPQDQITLKDNGQNKIKKLGSDEIKRVQSAIEVRAERILQQMQLQKLEGCLALQKKKTKLHQLDRRCRKLVENQNKIRTAGFSCEASERRDILSEFERKTINQIKQLDRIIGGFVAEKAKSSNADDDKLQSHKKVLLQKANLGRKGLTRDKNEQPEQNQVQQELAQGLMLPIFWKSTEELLSLDYLLI